MPASISFFLFLLAAKPFETQQKQPDGKSMQINLTGFLNGSKAREFMGELWQLLHSAMNSETGIPDQLIQEKANEIRQRVT